MILNNVTVLRDNKLIETDIEFEDQILRMRKGLGRGVDCAGMFLMPGLTNAHSHVASRMVTGAAIGLEKYEYFDKAGFKVHDRRTEKDIYNASVLACLEYLKNGVTHVDTMDMNPEVVIKAIKKVGLDYTACLAVKDAHKEAKNIEKQFKTTLRLKKEYGNKVVLGLANELECSPQLLRQGLEFAQENDLPIHMHACETAKEVKYMKDLTGKRTIPYLKSIGMLDHDLRLAHCTYINSKEILYLSNSQVPVLHCPTSNHSITGNEAPVKDMLRNQVPVMIGTDIFPWNPNPSVLHEAWLSHKLTGITLEKAYSITQEPLVVGGDASFSLINMQELKPFRDISEFLAKLMNYNAIESVYLKGREVVKEGENLLGINEKRLEKRVEKMRKKLLK